MKKTFFLMLSVLLLALTCVFGISACSPDESQSQRIKIVGLEIFVKDSDTPNFYACTVDKVEGNKEAFTLNDIKVYYLYSKQN